MLAELYKLKMALEKVGIEPELTHPNFQSPPGLTTYKTLIAKIDEDGRICSLRIPLEEEHSGLWTLKKGNFHYFPAVRLSAPLYDIPLESSYRKELETKQFTNAENWKKVANSAIQSFSSSSDSEPEITSQDFTALYENQAKRFLGFTKGDSNKIQALKLFASGFKNFSQIPKKTANKMKHACFAAIETNPSKELADILTHLLFGHIKKKKDETLELNFKMQIISDLENPNELAFSLHTSSFQKLILENLNNAQTSKATSKGLQTCAFGGSQPLLKSTFGGFSAKPVINKEQAPFSKKGGSSVPCNNRYLVSGCDSFPISERLSVDLVSALETITNEINKDKSWRPLKNGKLERKNKKSVECSDVLIAFTDFPFDGSTVSTFAKPQAKQDEDTKESSSQTTSLKSKRRKSSFYQVSEPICEGFRKKLQVHPMGKLNILLIREISPGQIQLSYDSRINISDFIEAVESWEKTELNLPAIKIPVPITDVGLRSLEPRLLFPEEIALQLSYQWRDNGTQASRVHAPPIGHILDMFLCHPRFNSDSARELLSMVLLRSHALLLHGGEVMRSAINAYDMNPWQDFVCKTKDGKPDKSQPDPKWHLLKNISLIGTLLSKLNSTKEQYMKDTAYLLGQLLAYSDELHKHYHYGNSKGKLPSRLIGNGLVSRALDDPRMALADLAERSVIYLGWAKTASTIKLTEKESKELGEYTSKAIQYAASNARKVLKKLEPLASSLNASLAQRKAGELTTEEKAHLYLGYLSPEPIWENKDQAQND